jgi:integrase
MMHEGRRVWISLDTGNASEAAITAASKWSLLKAKGWDAVKPRRKQVGSLTVGQYIAAISDASIFRKSTFESYTKKFRQLVSEIKGLSVSSRQAPNKAAEWVTSVHAVKLTEITDERIESWRSKRLSAFPEDSQERQRAETTVNSILRNARSLFGRKVSEHANLRLESPPLINVRVASVEPTAYTPEIDFDELMESAANELDGDIKLVFLLAAGCGLRRSEVDRLRREDIRYTKVKKRIIGEDGKDEDVEVMEGRISIDDTPDGQTKTAKSKRTIPFSKKGPLAEALHSSQLGMYVVCPSAPLPKVRKLGVYRCDKAFHELTAWLRNKGIKRASQPIHYLRKSFGDRIAETHGIHSAANTLGNSIKLAHTVYSDRTKTKGII